MGVLFESSIVCHVFYVIVILGGWPRFCGWLSCFWFCLLCGAFVLGVVWWVGPGFFFLVLTGFSWLLFCGGWGLFFGSFWRV